MRRQLNFINGNEQLPEWKAYSLTGGCLRSPTRGNAVANFRPTSCLPFGWKLAIRNYLKRRLCSKGIRRTNGRALGVKAILEECKEIETTLTMAWTGHKAFGMCSALGLRSN